MKFRYWLLAAGIAALGHLVITGRTENDIRYDGPTSQGNVKIENVDRHPFYRRDDRVITLEQEDFTTGTEYTTTFFNHNLRDYGQFMNDENDFVEERTIRRKKLTTKKYTTTTYEENGTVFREGTPEFGASRLRVQELTDLFWDLSSEGADSIITQSKRQAELDYREKHKRH